MSRIWDWIKHHTGWIAGGIVALGVAWYLLTHMGGGGGGATTVSFPASGSSGGGGGGSPGPGPAPAPTGGGNLPYSPDYSIIGAITDNALKSLENQLINLENQANQAYLTGNTSLFNTLQASIQSLQGQIANYQPAATGGGTPTLQGWITTAAANLLPGQSGYWGELINWINGSQGTVSQGAYQLWTELINTYGPPVGFKGLNPTVGSIGGGTTGGGGGTTPTGPGWTIPTVTATTVSQLVNDYDAILAKYGSVSTDQRVAFWQSVLNVPAPVAAYVQQQSDAYTNLTGIRSTPSQIQTWLQSAYSQNIGGTTVLGTSGPYPAVKTP